MVSDDEGVGAVPLMPAVKRDAAPGACESGRLFL